MCKKTTPQFIQVLNVSGYHWAVFSNVLRENRVESIGYYDSAHSFTVGVSLRETVCSFYKSGAAFLHFDIMNVMEQPNMGFCVGKCH